ncbi:MAG: RNA ligase, Rnl2 family [Bacteroidales bacterium]|nr:RNA ligase, Rnl2 family [Bacteroidales bacterium]
MTFKKYNSIENTFDRDFMDHIRTKGYAEVPYVVQEKVHGANCSFITDGNDVSFAKRSAPVEPGEQFYCYEDVLERYRERVIALFEAVKRQYPDTVELQIYGELFGGSYPHPDVKRIRNIMTIQKGVFYCPWHDFYGFDLFIHAPETYGYLPVDAVARFFEEGGFLYARTLFEGTLDQCLEYSNAFPSKISEWLGLPPIDGNICEGVVIRPKEPLYLPNGARVLLKNKNAKFAEKKQQRRHVRAQNDPEYSPELCELMATAEDYVTDNRLNNVISKIGHVSLPRDMGKLIGLFSKDIIEDFLKEHNAEYIELDKNEQKLFNKFANKQAISLIKQSFNDIHWSA